MRKQLILIIIMAVVTGLLPLSAITAEAIDIQMEPNVVQIGAFYNGGHVSVSGDIPHDAEVIIQLSGATQDAEFLKKGRVFGVLWMNTDTISFHDIPEVYMLYLPSAISESDLSKEHMPPVGFNALKGQCTLTPAGEDKDLQFQEFIKLKTMEGIYAVKENAVTYHNNMDNKKKIFACELEIPSRMAQGIYTVTTFILKKGKVIQTEDRQLKIKETGLPAMINSLAFDHAVLYGILATLIAIAAGLLTGVIFKGQKGGH